MTVPHPAPTPSSARGTSRIFGEGEMAQRTREFDWSHTPLGSIDTWDDSLITTVNLLLECRNPMLLLWGPELRQVYNDAFSESLRTDKHPLALGQRGRECWAEIWSTISPQFDIVLSGGSVFHREMLVPILRDGILTDVYWTYSYSPVRSSTGRVMGILVVCADVTEEVLSRRRLRESESRFRRLVEEASVGFVLGDLEGNLTYLNPLMLQKLGYTAAEVEAGTVSWKDITPAEYAVADQKAIEQLLTTGRAAPYEKAYIARDGRRIPLLIGATMMRSEVGSKDEIAVFLTDLTDLHRAESALRQSEKLAVVGRLASSIAHEINNPLEAVTNLLFLAAQEPASSETPHYLQMAQDELRRVATIATQTLRFHRQSHARPTEPAILLREVLTIFQGRLTAADITVDERYRHTPPVCCFDGDIRQVFANLFANSLDATRSGGCLFLRSRSATHWASGRKGVLVTVADSGHGMSAATREHIFEPFFTTKEATGTGLGLWITAEILRKHRAELHIRSWQGSTKHGTIFQLWFPIDAAIPPQA